MKLVDFSNWWCHRRHRRIIWRYICLLDGFIHFLCQTYLVFVFNSYFLFLFYPPFVAAIDFLSRYFNELKPNRTEAFYSVSFRFIQHILCFGPHASKSFSSNLFQNRMIIYIYEKQESKRDFPYTEKRKSTVAAALHSRIKTTQSKCRVNSLQSECRFSPYIFTKKRSISIRKIKTVFSFRVRVWRNNCFSCVAYDDFMWVWM